MNRRFWVGLAVFLCFALLAWLVWWLGPYIAIRIERGLHASIEQCTLGGTGCDEAFARLGQVGDLFGPISSLFSGLALLAVAVTVWIDASNRRVSRKPIIICEYDGVVSGFDEPRTTSPRDIRFTSVFKVRALNDVGLNVTLTAKLRSADQEIALPKASPSIPLSPDGLPQEVEIVARFEVEKIQFLIEALKRSSQFELIVSAECESLEGVRWVTGAEYILSFRDSDTNRMCALDKAADICDEAWANQAMAQPKCTVRPGSWSHRK